MIARALTFCITSLSVLTALTCTDEEPSPGSTARTQIDVAHEAGVSDAGSEDLGGVDAQSEVSVQPTVLPIEPSSAFLARQAEYLDACAADNGPNEGSLYGQSCRVRRGVSELNDEQIDGALAHLAERRDTADFRANGLVRLLYLDDETGALGDERRGRIEAALLSFKYWLDEPGDDGMAYWTENHQVLFHTAELLAGQRFEETAFSNSQMTGADHVAHALPRLERWLELRGRYGFSEWHSNVYLNEDIPALLNLVDFAEDEHIQELAKMVLDVVALDLLHNTFQGTLATTHGRTYQSKFIGGANDSTREAAWIMLGLGEYRSTGNFGGTFLATSAYFPPPILEDLAVALSLNHEHRQRDSFDIADGPEIGISYEGLEDTVVWAGLSAIVAPDVIDGSMAVFEEYDLWDGFLFGDLPPEMVSILRNANGTPQLRKLSEEFYPLSQGMALEGIDTYVYRTPNYQLAGAQDYKPGLWAAQTLMWRASLDPEAFVLTTSPALVGLGDVSDITIDDPWIGGWLPRVTLFRNVGVIQYYEDPDTPPSLVDSFVSGDYLHAYFPRSAFDEVTVSDGWFLGRAGDGYVALWSQVELTQSEENDYELIAPDGRTNIFIVELGSRQEHGDFAAFTSAITGAELSVTEGEPTAGVRYVSPSVGVVEVSWEGPLAVDGEIVDLGPYERWQTEGTQQASHSPILEVTLDGRRLTLDFEVGTRQLVELPPGVE